jgi:tetratricopeptide (TPR) repeat protein
MSKNRKLRRYAKKDYSETVTFPVEIVGRDGGIRSFSFEQSIRLYQRRIASAVVRYADKEIMLAEETHCSRRIDQMRRSKLENSHFPVGVFSAYGNIAGEVVACLEGLFGEVATLAPVAIEGFDSEGVVAWYLEHASDGFLIYLHNFKGESPATRASFFDQLGSVRCGQGLQVESLVAYHHTADCGVVVTTQSDVSAKYRWTPSNAMWVQPASGGVEARPDELFRAGYAHVALGEVEAAIVLFEQAIDLNPWHKGAHVALISCQNIIENSQEAEVAARLALHHFPQEKSFSYLLSAVQYQQGNYKEAMSSLTVALVHPPMPIAIGLAARIQFEQGHLIQAAKLFDKSKEAHRFLERSVETEIGIAWRSNRLMGMVVVLASLVQTFWASRAGIMDSNIGLACALILGVTMFVVGLVIVAKRLKSTKSQVALQLSSDLLSELN